MRWTRLHMALILLGLLTIGTLLVLSSHDARATRQPGIDSAATLEHTNQRITLPLEFSLPASTSPEINTPAAVSETHEDTLEWQQVTVKRGDTLAAIFKRQGLSPRDLHDIMALGTPTRRLKTVVPGQQFRLRIDAQQQLQELVFEINRLESLQIRRSPDGFTASTAQRELDKRLSYTNGVISSSLFEAGNSAGMSDTLTMELAGIFGWDIDFALDIRTGDQFSLIYEEQYLDGKKVGDGAIIAAEFTNQDRTYRAIRYTDTRGRSDYFTPEGLSMRKAFLRTPVDFRRISSRFGRRHHPVLNSMRMHKGVDYAASRGTPIKAAGDGKVIFRGRKGGYGRAVIIQHGGRYSTLYAHMSKFRRGVSAGKRVKQGQIIGYVGSSGRATGSHLHYEFRVNGVHRNPLTVKLPNAAPIQAQYKDDFTRHAQAMLSQLAVYGQTRVAAYDN